MKDNQSLLKKRDKLILEIKNLDKQVRSIDRILTEREIKKCLKQKN